MKLFQNLSMVFSPQSQFLRGIIPEHKTPSSTNIKVDIKGKLGNIYLSVVTNLILLEVARDILFLTSPYLSKSVSLSNGLLKPGRISTFSQIHQLVTRS